MKLEKMFRRIHTNSANLFHGRSPLFEICNDLILAQSMPSGAVHTIIAGRFRNLARSPMRTGAANLSASGLKRQDNELIVIERAEAAAA